MDNPHFFRLLSDTLTQESVAAIDEHLAKNAHITGEHAVLNAHFSIMDIYPIVRPVLLFIQGILFFKPAWATAIKALIASLDAIYMPAQPGLADKMTTGIPGLNNPSSPAASNTGTADEQNH
jgi:hypothetical protein